MLESTPYQKHVELAEHYLATGMKDIWLYRRYDDQVKVTDVDLPWEHATSVKANSGYPVDLDFEAKHPSGLTFHWSFYFQPRHDTGLQFDLARLNVMLQKVPRPLHRALKEILLVKLHEAETEVERFRQLYVDHRERTKAFRQLVEGIVEEE